MAIKIFHSHCTGNTVIRDSWTFVAMTDAEHESRNVRASLLNSHNTPAARDSGVDVTVH